MAFCEQCGTPIPDGQRRCANCAPAQKVGANVDVIGAIKNTGLNFVGLIAQLFNILMLCLPVIKANHIWEIAENMGAYWIVAFGVIAVILASVFGYLFNQEKVAKIAGIVNLIAFLIVWFPFSSDMFPSFQVGFYLWLVGVILQLAAPIAMKYFNQYTK
jgi:hypothetical protein